MSLTRSNRLSTLRLEPTDLDFLRLGCCDMAMTRQDETGRQHNRPTHFANRFLELIENCHRFPLHRAEGSTRFLPKETATLRAGPRS